MREGLYRGFRFRVWGVGFRVWDVGFRITLNPEVSIGTILTSSSSAAASACLPSSYDTVTLGFRV